jgi:hypothetical protein
MNEVARTLKKVDARIIKYELLNETKPCLYIEKPNIHVLALGKGRWSVSNKHYTTINNVDICWEED